MEKRICVCGRVDTASVAQLDAEIGGQLVGVDKDARIVLDATDLEYISSSGLRVVLKYKKLYPNLCVQNVSNEVYQVFEMTGFCRIMEVSKALRKINLEECTELAHGANGAVYRVNDEEVVKVSLVQDVQAELECELDKNRETFLLGLPTPISFDVVDCGEDRRGVVFEAINSETLGAYLNREDADRESYAREYAKILHSMHKVTPTSELFLPVKDWYVTKLTSDNPTRFIDEEDAQVLRSLFDAIPEAPTLVHGDAHPKNMLMSGDGERSLMIIDMADLGTGHPIYELMGIAFIMLAPIYSPSHAKAQEFTGINDEAVRHDFMRRTFRYLFNETDEKEIDHIMQASANVGLIRMATIMQRHAVPDEIRPHLVGFIHTYVVERREELLQDIAYLCERLDRI